MTIKEKTEQIKQFAFAAGFDKAGIAIARKLDKSDFLETWLSNGRHGQMSWMENYLNKRQNVQLLYPGAKYVIVVAHNYFSSERHSTDINKAKISRYAWGKDYHKFIKKKLKQLLKQIQEMDSQIQGRVFCDTAPIQDKLWATQAGLGWQGKHTNLITRDLGSWVFLGEIVINQELEYDAPVRDYCGSCTACIDACPTDALVPYQLDATRCLSYLTIEYWDKPIPDPLKDKLNNWVFGCDICQDVCPWNRMAKQTKETQYMPAPENVTPELSELLDLNEDDFKARFKKSPVSRAKYNNFIRNVKTVQDKHKK